MGAVVVPGEDCTWARLAAEGPVAALSSCFPLAIFRSSVILVPEVAAVEKEGCIGPIFKIPVGMAAAGEAAEFSSLARMFLSTVYWMLGGGWGTNFPLTIAVRSKSFIMENSMIVGLSGRRGDILPGGRRCKGSSRLGRKRPL